MLRPTVYRNINVRSFVRFRPTVYRNIHLRSFVRFRSTHPQYFLSIDTNSLLRLTHVQSLPSHYKEQNCYRGQQAVNAKPLLGI